MNRMVAFLGPSRGARLQEVFAELRAVGPALAEILSTLQG